MAPGQSGELTQTPGELIYRASDLGEQLVVLAMRPDPEPHDEPLSQDADGPPVKVDPGGVDRESRVHLPEPKKRTVGVRRPRDCMPYSGFV